MTTVTEAKVLLLTQEDFDALSKAASQLSTLLWRTQYRRELKIRIPMSEKTGAAVLPFHRAAAGTGPVDHDDEF